MVRIIIRLLIAGSGPSLENLKSEAEAKVPGTIAFLGHIGDREKLADIYANVDAFVHTNPMSRSALHLSRHAASGIPCAKRRWRSFVRQ